MNSKWTLVVMVLSIISLHTYRAYQPSGISGRVSQQESGETVWAINDADSTVASPRNGVFTLDVKPGVYKILVKAQQPFKNLVVEAVEVTQGRTTDLGLIKLIQ